MRSSRPASSPLRSVAALAFLIPSTVALPLGAQPAADVPSDSGDAPAESNPAAERPRVILLLRTPGDDDTMSRLRFELQDGGWRILELRPDERFEAEPLASAAEREGATAAVRVDGPRSTVELWVRSPQGPVGETFTASGEHAVGPVLALRVAEALRARGLLVPGTPAPPREEPPKPPPPVEEEREPPLPPPTHPALPVPGPRLSLELGPGVTLSPGGLGPLAVLDAGVRLELARVWSLTLSGMVPLTRQRIAGAEGRAEIATTVAGALIELEWATFGFGGFRSGFGAGASISSMSGRAASGFGGTRETVTVFTPLARTSLHVDLAPWLRLRPGVAAGATVPTLRVAFGSREVARWGRPFVLGSVVLEASPIQ
jgi:hypothetical protein